MKRWVRRAPWVGLALTVVALALGVTERLLTPTPGVTKVNFDRVKVGMTYRQVEDLLGYPAILEEFPGILRRHGANGLRPSRDAIEAALPKMSGLRAANGGFVIWPWDGEQGIATVYFGADGRVQRMEWLQRTLPQDSNFLVRLRSLLGW